MSVLKQNVGGNIGDINIAKNFNNDLKIKGVLNDGVIAGNALGGNIADSIGNVANSKIANLNIEALGKIITPEYLSKFGKNGIIDGQVFDGFATPTMLPNINAGQIFGIGK